MIIINNEKSSLIVLKKDQYVLKTLTEICIENNWQGGFFTAIGAIKNVELGFYHLDQKDYHRKTFDKGDFELISLNANLSLKDKTPYVHAHISMGDENFHVFGGHLFEAQVAVTLEIGYFPIGKMPERTLDPSLGLATICKI